MTVYFYHTQNIQRIWKEYREGIFPGHFLYGATHLGKYGIEVILHQSIDETVRWKLSIATAFRILTCRKRYDILYATHTRGIELIIFLRALGLYRHKIVVWHHQPIKKATNPLRELIARLFYRGLDQMIFFSEKLVNDSLNSKKSERSKMHVIPWGGDLEYYDRLGSRHSCKTDFISTGKELRDLPTLIDAFNLSGEAIDIYVNERNGNIGYAEIAKGLKLSDNVKLHFFKGLDPYCLGRKVAQSKCMAICCLESDYTVGLTTLVEAMSLGIPVICSNNPQIPIDIDDCGIAVPYGDVDAWVKAIRKIADDSEFASRKGRSGRKLAEREFNLENCSKRVADLLLSC